MINFPAISWREQGTFLYEDDDVRFVLDQRAELHDIHSASSLKQQVRG
jgi:hypothetical protein